jgi:hypothetical protein
MPGTDAVNELLLLIASAASQFDAAAAVNLQQAADDSEHAAALVAQAEQLTNVAQTATDAAVKLRAILPVAPTDAPGKSIFGGRIPAGTFAEVLANLRRALEGLTARLAELAKGK